MIDATMGAVASVPAEAVIVTHTVAWALQNTWQGLLPFHKGRMGDAWHYINWILGYGTPLWIIAKFALPWDHVAWLTAMGCVVWALAKITWKPSWGVLWWVDYIRGLFR